MKPLIWSYFALKVPKFGFLILLFSFIGLRAYYGYWSTKILWMSQMHLYCVQLGGSPPKV